ncbi:MAG: colanic acid biosynthesis glycosyltransferase WcaL, partial [Planctomycetota bacterium]
MKIAYLTSKYPGLSHTFILREVQALRGAGIDVGTFTVRKAPAGDVLGAESEAEAARTRWLVPVPWLAWMRAAGWALLTRPRRLLQALWHAVARGVEPRQRLVWLCYFCEAL